MTEGSPPNPAPPAGISTSTQQYVPGQESNPFIRDYQSSVLYQELSPPNEKSLRTLILNSQIKIAHLAQQQQLHQTSGEEPDTMIAKMMLPEEQIVSSTLLRVRKVSWMRGSGGAFVTQGDSHLGVRAQVSNNRLLLIDSTLDTEDILTPTTPSSSFLMPARTGESYQLISRRTNDIWFKPISLNSITGLEIYSSHRAESSIKVANRVHPIALLFVFMSVFSLMLFVAVPSGIWAAVLLLSIVSSVLSYLFFAIPKAERATANTWKRREIQLGYYDTLLNVPVVMSLELEDSQNLSQAYQWCRCLQNHSPRLSGEKDPLILL